jgi:NADH:ubiquinone oxidoreductase subunit D
MPFFLRYRKACSHKWGAYTIHAAQHLTAHGVLIVTLKVDGADVQEAKAWLEEVRG